MFLDGLFRHWDVSIFGSCLRSWTVYQPFLWILDSETLSRRLFCHSFLLICDHLIFVFLFWWSVFLQGGFSALGPAALQAEAEHSNKRLNVCVPAVSSQTAFVPPREVLTLPSGRVVVRWAVSVPWSPVWTEAEAEAGGAVADFEQAVGAEEGFPFASSQVVDRLQVVVDGDVPQLFAALLRPPPLHEDDPHRQQQQQQQR